MTTPIRRTSRLLAGLAVAAIAVALGVVTAAPAYAATFTVTNGASSGAGSLPQAITDANGSAGSTITIAPGLVIDMSGFSNPQVTASVTIEGDASNPPTIIGPNSAPIFQVTGPPTGVDLEVDDVIMQASTTVTSGDAITTAGGPGTVTLTDDTFQNFPHPAVELLLQTGDLTVTDCTFTGNSATVADSDGGAIIVGSVNDLTVTGSTFSNNTAGHNGGAIFLNAANSVNISGSAFANNSAGIDGGAIGISNFSGDSTWTGNTFTGNSSGATGFIGGAAFEVDTILAGVTLTIDQSTFSGNSSTSGVVPPRGGVGYVNDVEGTLLLSSSTMTGNSFGGTGIGNGLDVAVGIIGDTGEFDVLQSTLDETGASTPLLFAGSNNNFFRLASSTFFGPGILQVPSNANAAVNAVEARDVIAISTDATPAFQVAGTPAEIGYSITSDTAGPQLVGLLGMQFGVTDAGLGPLANNGGPTQTRLPVAGSPAIDLGDPGFTVPATDQRGTGFARVVNGRVDIGAVEVQTSPALAATGVDSAPTAWMASTSLATGLLLLGALLLTRRARRNTAKQAIARR